MDNIGLRSSLLDEEAGERAGSRRLEPANGISGNPKRRPLGSSHSPPSGEQGSTLNGRETVKLELRARINSLIKEFGFALVRAAFLEVFASFGFSLISKKEEAVELAAKERRTSDTVKREIEERVKARWPQDRIGKMSPVDFIKYYYADWIGDPLFVRSHIADDEKLASGYASWIRPDRHPEDSIWPEIDGKRREHKIKLDEMTPAQRRKHDKAQNSKHQRNYCAAHFVP